MDGFNDYTDPGAASTGDTGYGSDAGALDALLSGFSGASNSPAWDSGTNGMNGETGVSGALQTALQPNDVYNPGSPSAKEIAEAAGGSGSGSGSGKGSIMDSVGKLFTDKNGDMDIGKILKIALGAAPILNQFSNKGRQQGTQTAAQLQAQLVQPHNTWTPAQANWSNNFFQQARPTQQTVGASQLPSAIVQGRGYADGGAVDSFATDPRRNIWEATRRKQMSDAGLEDYTPQTLQAGRVTRAEAPHVGVSDLLHSIPQLIRSLMGSGRDEVSPNPAHYADGGDVMTDPGQMDPSQGQQTGFLGLVTGQGGGQDDLVDAKLSPGEYVFDADTVSAVGDGNNDHGAKILDEWRQKLREAKRAAPSDEIPPLTGDPQQYMPAGAQ